jgi:hypothetical protein
MPFGTAGVEKFLVLRDAIGARACSGKAATQKLSASSIPATTYVTVNKKKNHCNARKTSAAA